MAATHSPPAIAKECADFGAMWVGMVGIPVGNWGLKTIVPWVRPRKQSPMGLAGQAGLTIILSRIEIGAESSHYIPSTNQGCRRLDNSPASEMNNDITRIIPFRASIIIICFGEPI